MMQSLQKRLEYTKANETSVIIAEWTALIK